MADFTPGPWSVADKIPYEVQEVTGHDDETVADIYGVAPQQVRGNAQLISAAPDLYAACQRACEFCAFTRRFHGDTSDAAFVDESHAVFEILLDAIAKAEREEA